MKLNVRQLKCTLSTDANIRIEETVIVKFENCILM
jgi:hypothetical protein